MYGIVFEDRCLHFAVMAYSSTFSDGTTMKAEFFEFLSKMNHNLMVVIKADTVSETHLFAIFFALAASQGGSASFRYLASRDDYINIYSSGFLKIMRHLNSRRKSVGYHRNCLLESSWRYLLTQMFRWFSSDPEGLHQSSSPPGVLAAYVLGQEIADVISSMDNRNVCNYAVLKNLEDSPIKSAELRMNLVFKLVELHSLTNDEQAELSEYDLKDRLKSVYNSRGDIDAAIIGWKQLLLDSPLDSALIENLRNAYTEKSAINVAIWGWKELLRRNPSDYKVQDELERAYGTKGSINDAILGWMELAQNHPSEYGFLRKLKRAYDMKGDIDEAILGWKELIRRNPSETDIQWTLKKAYTDKGDLNEAIAGWKELLLHNSSNVQLQWMLEQAYKSKGEIDDEITGWMDLVRANPLIEGYQQHLESAYNVKGENSNAIVGWSELVKIHPNCISIQRRLQRAYLAHVPQTAYLAVMQQLEPNVSLSVVQPLNRVETGLFKSFYNAIEQIYSKLDELDDSGIEFGIDILPDGVPLAKNADRIAFSGILYILSFVKR